MKYFSTQRPLTPGSFPKSMINPVMNVVNFDQKTFCEEMKPTYLDCVAKAFAPGSTPRQDGKFSHFLDCESHTDVWRELFPSLNLTNCLDEE